MRKLTRAFFLALALVLMGGLCLVAAGPVLAQDVAVEITPAPCIDISVVMDGNTITANLGGELFTQPIGGSYGACSDITVMVDPYTMTGLLNGEPIISLPNPITGLVSGGTTGSPNTTTALQNGGLGSLPISLPYGLCSNLQFMLGNASITGSIGSGGYTLSIGDGCSSITLNGAAVNMNVLPSIPPSAASPGGCANIAATMDGNTIAASLDGMPIVLPIGGSSGNCGNILVALNADGSVTASMDGQPIALPIDAFYRDCASITVGLGGNNIVTANFTKGSFALAMSDGCSSIHLLVSWPYVTSVQVQPGEAPIMIGARQQFSAVALYTYGFLRDVTSTATWRSSRQDVASIDNAGLAQGTTVGASEVQATFDGVTSDPARLTVSGYSPPSLDSLELRPESGAIQVGDSQQFAAWARYSDGTEVDVTAQASWDSGNESIASVSSGLAQGLTEGTTDITATLLGKSDDAVLSVTAPPPAEPPAEPGNVVTVPVAAAEPTVLEVVVEPDRASVVAGGIRPLTATALYSDGTELDVTSAASWDSSKAGVCTVASGLVTGVAPGACAITANYAGASDSVILNVTAADNAGLASGKDGGDSEITAEPAAPSVVPVSVPWSMIGGIIGAVLLLGLVFLALMRRRTKDVHKA